MSVELLKLEGAGLVNWLRLTAADGVLANEDLWIEVTVDGETLPAIAAPARFFYPGLAGGAARQFSSMVLTREEGFANLLAMPYGNGLTVAVRNRGAAPIENVSVSASVDKSGDKAAEYASRMRLRGIYQPAGAGGTLVEQAGTGRWVGFVYQQPEGTKTGISAVEIDGQSQPGWSMEYLDAFFGRPGEGENYFTALAAHQGQLAYRYLLLAPVGFHKSLVVRANANDTIGGRLALFYLAK
jgi:hypothetical protein